MKAFVISLVIIVLAAAAPAAAAPQIIRCVDGLRDTSGPGDILCDTDGLRNRSCTFVSACPLCYYQKPACLAPCTDPPSYEWATVRLGRSERVRVGDVSVLLRCERYPRERPTRPPRPERPARPQTVR